MQKWQQIFCTPDYSIQSILTYTSEGNGTYKILYYCHILMTFFVEWFEKMTVGMCPFPRKKENQFKKQLSVNLLMPESLNNKYEEAFWWNNRQCLFFLVDIFDLIMSFRPKYSTSKSSITFSCLAVINTKVFSDLKDLCWKFIQTLANFWSLSLYALHGFLLWKS